MPWSDKRILAGGAALTAVLAAVLALPGTAQAQQGATTPTGLQLSSNLPIQIESDKLEVREKESMAIFTGNVTVTQADTLMKSGKMTVFYVKQAGGSATSGMSEIDHIEVNDKVYVKSKTQVATGDRGTFDMKADLLTLSGKEVVLSDGPNVLVGCKLTVKMSTGLANVDGCPKGEGGSGRVIMSITPGSQQPAPAAP
jgi:lipopolysaccharide export system protein LptA